MNGKDQVRRILIEAFGQGRLEVLDEVLTPDFVNHNAPPGAPRGIEGVKWVIAMERRGFPDLTYTIERELQEGDYVVQHAWVEGTHLGEIFGVPATGRRVRWQEIHIGKIESDGRCSAHWGVNDMANLWVQIGRAERPRVVFEAG